MNPRILILGGGGVVVVLLLVYFAQQRGTDWTPRLDTGLERPYDTGLFYARAAQRFDTETPARERLDDLLSDSTHRRSAYAFVGQSIFYDSTTLQHLLRYASAGNTVLLSVKSMPQDLMWELLYEECADTYWNDFSTYRDTAVTLTLRHPELQQRTTRGKHLFAPEGYRKYAWNYIEPYFFCDEVGMTALGQMDSAYINFARLDYGSGRFYLHTTPLVLSNYALLDSSAQSYADALLAHLSVHADHLILDEVNGVSEAFNQQRNNRINDSWNPPSGLSNDTPLRFILDQPPLAWAWYLLIGSGLLYVLFRAKRRQRVIPVVETNRNTSMEYIKTVGQLYFQREHHKKLIQQQMRLLLRHLRDRYHLATHKLDDAFIREAAARSGVAETHVRRTFDMYDRIERSGIVTDNTLVDFHRLVNHFYRAGE